MIDPATNLAMHVMLAQDSLSVPAQIEYTVERVLTPGGAALAVAMVGLGALVVTLRKTVPFMLASILFLSTLQLTNMSTMNVLLGPVQTLRAMAKSLGFLMLLLAVLLLATVPIGQRLRSAGPASLGFLGFQLYYVTQLTLFASDYELKGLLGIVTMVLMFLVFGVMFGRTLQDLDSARTSFGAFAWIGLAHVAINMIQIVVSPAGALVGGRLAGTGGNAQMMGCVSCLLLLVNTYLYYESRKGQTTKWVSLLNIGFLGVFVLATGSRTAVLATGVGLLVMLGLRMGRSISLAITGLIGVAAVSMFIGDPTAVVTERFAGAGNTRRELWMQALAIFADSPVFGELPFLKPGEEPNGIESTFIRVLANMGILGAVIAAIPTLFVISYATSALRIKRAGGAAGPLAGMFLGLLAAQLVFNVFDGYAYGFLTFPVIFLHITFATGQFLSELPDWETSEIADAEAVPA